MISKFIQFKTCWLIVQSGEAFTGVSREEYIDKVASDILIKLPVEFDLDKIRKKLGMEISPTTVVLLQELERFNILNGRMNRTLSALRKVIYNIRLLNYYLKYMEIYIASICDINQAIVGRQWNYHQQQLIRLLKTLFQLKFFFF